MNGRGQLQTIAASACFLSSAELRGKNTPRNPCETCRGGLTMSVHRGRLEENGTRPPQGSKGQKIHNYKKAPASLGFGLRRWVRSVSGRDRCAVSTEAIIQPKRDHVNILADPAAGEDEPSGSNHACEAGIMTPHPEMVVFDTERPVGREAVLPADTEGAAPACVACRCQADPGDVVEYIESICASRRRRPSRRVPLLQHSPKKGSRDCPHRHLFVVWVERPARVRFGKG